MTVQVRLFAIARQLAGCDTIGIELAEPATVRALRGALAHRVPGLTAVLPHVLFSINAEYARDDTAIPPDAEIACLPPVSGG